MKGKSGFVALGLAVLCLLVGIGSANSNATSASQVECTPGNGGISLPKGFCAVVVADNLGRARHLTVAANGDVYVALSSAISGSGIVALRDTNGDGRADIIRRFGDLTGTGIGIRNGYLYFASNRDMVRYRLQKGHLLPDGVPEPIVSGLPEQHQHAAKSFAFDNHGFVYINIGAPSNDCQVRDRTRGSPGRNPCLLLARHGGIWRFRSDDLNQTQSGNGSRYATGIRNAVAIAWNPLVSTLYIVQHGRDQLAQLWPDLYTLEQSAELPAEEFFAVHDGDNFGWPYCYYDQIQHKALLNPEYGGDGRKTGYCGQYEKPIMAFPGHWAPDALLFYTGNQFPASYHGGAFIAFHGSWNRAPLPQEGYKVVFVPFKGAMPAGGYTTFADGFAGSPQQRASGNARFRPVGLAQGPDGSLYISDSKHGRIWRVVYKGGR